VVEKRVSKAREEERTQDTALQYTAFYGNPDTLLWVTWVYNTRHVVRDNCLDETTRGWAQAVVHERLHDGFVWDSVECFDGVKKAYRQRLL
jgi:hypothetical protein